MDSLNFKFQQKGLVLYSTISIPDLSFLIVNSSTKVLPLEINI